MGAGYSVFWCSVHMSAWWMWMSECVVVCVLCVCGVSVLCVWERERDVVSIVRHESIKKVTKKQKDKHFLKQIVKLMIIARRRRRRGSLHQHCCCGNLPRSLLDIYNAALTWSHLLSCFIVFLCTVKIDALWPKISIYIRVKLGKNEHLWWISCYKEHLISQSLFSFNPVCYHRVLLQLHCYLVN